MSRSSPNPLRSAQDLFADAFQCYRSGDLEGAAYLCRRSLSVQPQQADPLHLLGAITHRQGRLDEAIDLVKQAIRANPRSPAFHANLGGMYRECGELAAALSSLREVLALNPAHAEACQKLGAILAEQQRLEEALPYLQRAVQLRPDHADAHFELGNLLLQSGRHDDAVVSLKRAVAFRPDHAQAHHNLGVAHKEMDRLNEAARCFQTALAFKPDLSETLNNLANVLASQMRVDEASRHYQRALDADPDNYSTFSNQLFFQNYMHGQTPETMCALARRFGARVAAKAHPFTSWQPRSNPALRVGIVSGDLGNHPVGYFLEALLGAADPARLTFVAFPSHHHDDELTARIKPRFAAWSSLVGLSDEAAARLIHDSGVDILIDLSGHTGYNRLPVFAWRPAPVQVTWLGYFATTGVAEIDYIIADPHVAPPGEEAHFTETVWRLPDIYYCFSPPLTQDEAAPPPALQNGFITFGCFNNLTKLNDAVLAVWSRLLRAIPQSRLILKSRQLRDAEISQITRDRFAGFGIGTDQLVLEPPAWRADYLRAYGRIDIALDPFPYPGGTTSFEALWMGVPVLTKRGDRFLSHAGETIMRNAGLPTWIAFDDDDYVARATHFAADIAHLAQLRARLRDQVRTSPLFDAPRFARHFEDAMHGMAQTRR